MPPSFGLRNLDLFETEYRINTRMHSSRMRTARSLLYRGASVWGGLYPGGSLSRGVSVRGDLCPGKSLSGRHPGRNMGPHGTRGRDPQKKHGTRDRGPRKKHGTRDRGPQKKHVTRDRDPQKGTWDQATRQEVTSYRDPSPCWQNDRCEWKHYLVPNFVCGR